VQFSVTTTTPTLPYVHYRFDKAFPPAIITTKCLATISGDFLSFAEAKPERTKSLPSSTTAQVNVAELPATVTEPQINSA